MGLPAGWVAVQGDEHQGERGDDREERTDRQRLARGTVHRPDVRLPRLKVAHDFTRSVGSEEIHSSRSTARITSLLPT